MANSYTRDAREHFALGGASTGEEAQVRSAMNSATSAGADHSLAITHTDQVAAALISFIRRHAMPSSIELSQ